MSVREELGEALKVRLHCLGQANANSGENIHVLYFVWVFFLWLLQLNQSSFLMQV